MKRLNKFYENAQEQYKAFGQVSLTYYPDRDYENGRSMKLTLSQAFELIRSVEESENDDIHVPHPNYF